MYERKILHQTKRREPEKKSLGNLILLSYPIKSSDN